MERLGRRLGQCAVAMGVMVALALSVVCLTYFGYAFYRGGQR